MQDTTPEFRRLVRERFARMPPEERVLACAGMFDAACAMVEASFPQGIDPVERRFRLCESFYGSLASRAYPHRPS